MLVSRTSRNRIIVFAVVGFCAVTFAGIAVVKGLKSNHHVREPQAESAPRRPISLIASGDTEGWIVPCGCTSNQSGGLLRRGTFVTDKKNNANVILVDAGGAAGGASPYDRTKFEAIIQGEIQMGIAAHNIGESEIHLGADYLQGLQKKHAIPFISANIRDTGGNFIVKTSQLVEASGKRLLIVGVISPEHSVSGIQISSPRDAVLEIADQHVNNYDWLVVLAYMPEKELRDFATDLPEADVILGGPTHQSIAPTSVGPTTLAAATNKGKFLVHLQAPLEDDRTRWTGQVIEVNDTFADDPAQKRNLQQFYSELEKQDFTAAQTEFTPPLPVNPPLGYQISGTESCLKCHEQDGKHWDDSSHAHAWKSLTASRAHFDADCQRCHTTGFGLPGGFASVGRSPSRVNVGCESCHGPSAAHIQNPKITTPFSAKDQCIECHDRENSPNFNYEEYWKQMIHGQQPALAAIIQQRLKTDTKPQP